MEKDEAAKHVAELQMKLNIALAGLKELERIYFDFQVSDFDLVEIRAIIYTTLRQLGHARRTRTKKGPEVTA